MSAAVALTAIAASLVVVAGGAVALGVKAWRWLDRMDDRLAVVGAIVDGLNYRGITVRRWLDDMRTAEETVTELHAVVKGHERRLGTVEGACERLRSGLEKTTERVDDLELALNRLEG